MTKSAMNLQDSFLNQVRKDNTEIQLVLLDGTRLNGYVRGFDNFTVIMNVRGAQHLIYKHAIAQIVSRRMTHAGEGEREGGHAHAQSAPDGPGEAPAEQAQGQPELPRRDHAPRRDRDQDRNRDRNRERNPERNPEQENGGDGKPKFNAIDLSSLKIEAEKQG